MKTSQYILLLTYTFHILQHYTCRLAADPWDFKIPITAGAGITQHTMVKKNEVYFLFTHNP